MIISRPLKNPLHQGATGSPVGAKMVA